MKKVIVLIFVTMLLVACSESGPKNTLSEMAVALENKDANKFLKQIDMSRFAAAQVNNMTKSSEPLKALDAVGRMLGLGGMEHLIGAVRDMQAKEIERFNYGISTGELVLMCKEAKTPNCPWVPQSLRDAKILNIEDNIAVAKVTTPTNITSWLALRKIGDGWKVVGQAALKDDAVNFAKGKKSEPEPVLQKNAPAPPPAPKKQESQEPVRL